MAKFDFNKPKVSIDAADLVNITLILQTYDVAENMKKGYDKKLSAKTKRFIKILRDEFAEQVPIKARAKIAIEIQRRYGVKQK